MAYFPQHVNTKKKIDDYLEKFESNNSIYMEFELEESSIIINYSPICFGLIKILSYFRYCSNSDGEIFIEIPDEHNCRKYNLTYNDIRSIYRNFDMHFSDACIRDPSSIIRYRYKFRESNESFLSLPEKYKTFTSHFQNLVNCEKVPKKNILYFDRFASTSPYEESEFDKNHHRVAFSYKPEERYTDKYHRYIPVKVPTKQNPHVWFLEYGETDKSINPSKISCRIKYEYRINSNKVIPINIIIAGRKIIPSLKNQILIKYYNRCSYVLGKIYNLSKSLFTLNYDKRECERYNEYQKIFRKKRNLNQQ